MKYLVNMKDSLIEGFKKRALLFLALALLSLSAFQAHAQTDATAIVTAVLVAFAAVASACVSIGTFFAVYRMAKRIK